MRCTVPNFGWTCSPYFTSIMLTRALELCIGNQTNTNNQFHWHHVKFNLPCTTGYDTILRCVNLIRFNGEVFVRFTFFFDYVRVYRLGAEHVRSI